MPGTYTYDPAEINKESISRMRFELGDTTFKPGELTAALCDEEYQSVLSSTKPWKKAKLACLRAILMKFAHQTDVSVKGVSYSFSKRLDFWKELYDELKAEGSTAVPSMNMDSMRGPDGGHYYHKDMHKNWSAGG